jgi:hypothetical protein
MPVTPGTVTTLQVDIPIKQRFIKQNAVEKKRHGDRQLVQQDYLVRLMDLYDRVFADHPELLPNRGA